MTIMDKACYERGCACYDDRVDKDGVEVVARQWQGLTDKELAEFSEAKLGAYDLCLEIEATLKARNTANAQDHMPLFDDWDKDWTK